MHLIYIDDSQDQNTGVYAFSALAVPADRWRSTFVAIRQFRRDIKATDGILVTKELHAWKFVSGRGNIANRIVTKSRRWERTMKGWDSYAILICDEGKEADYTRLVRKMGVYNPIPSRFGTWQGTQSYTKNIPLDRVVEDPFFKDSVKSYFIQMADFCAYALLRKECPLASKTKYGLDKAFALLRPICVLAANRRDQYGIIR